jgi:hypothetical protein
VPLGCPINKVLLVNEQMEDCCSYDITYHIMVGETHGTSECVSFSFIDAGSVLLPAWFFFSFHDHLSAPWP